MWQDSESEQKFFWKWIPVAQPLYDSPPFVDLFYISTLYNIKANYCLLETSRIANVWRFWWTRASNSNSKVQIRLPFINSHLISSMGRRLRRWMRGANTADQHNEFIMPRRKPPSGFHHYAHGRSLFTFDRGREKPVINNINYCAYELERGSIIPRLWLLRKGYYKCRRAGSVFSAFVWPNAADRR